MNAYHVNHITSSPHYPQSNDGLAEMYVQIVKSLFDKAIEEGEDLFKCLMIYCNTPLSGSVQSQMQILQSRSTRSVLTMSNAARQQLGLQPEKLRTVNKYQDAISKWWYPATITSLFAQPRSYSITTREGVTYRKTHTHVTPYQPQSQKSEDEHCEMQTLKANCKQSNSVDNKK